MSQETITSEIIWQTAGHRTEALKDPRWYAYRVLTVLRLDLTLDLVDATENRIQTLLEVPSFFIESCGEGESDTVFEACYDEECEDHNRAHDAYWQRKYDQEGTGYSTDGTYLYAGIPQPNDMPLTPEEEEQLA